ncbi:MAG: cell division protein FtsZ, partial [Acidobacteriota bacterium]
ASVKGARGVIINVTGGPDLSLMEVSEASAIIQEAAHEEANIIFGAVVDPKMEGRVKITVIATGFDRPGASRTSSAPATITPVDLQSYSSWKSQETVERVAAGGGSRMSFSRRAVLDLPMAPPKSIGMNDATAGAEFEPVSPLDVPAFLRRQSEG